LLLGEPITAERSGFFNRVVPADELLTTARSFMTRLVRGGPAALRGTRRVLQLLAKNETVSADELNEIAQLRENSRLGNEFARAQAAFLAREKSPFGE